MEKIPCVFISLESVICSTLVFRCISMLYSVVILLYALIRYKRLFFYTMCDKTIISSFKSRSNLHLILYFFYLNLPQFHLTR